MKWGKRHVNSYRSSGAIVLLLFFYGCIGEDIIDDFVEPQVRILNPTEQIEISQQHTYEAKYFNNIGLEEDIQIRWESSDEAIDSINANGTATGITGGTATITASVASNDGLVTVEESVEVPHVDPELRILNPVEEIAIGETHSYETQYFDNNGKEQNVAIVWESSDESIISIDDKGIATAHTGGTATILASVAADEGVITDEDTIEVPSLEPQVRILNPIDSLPIGDRHTYTATFFNSNGMEEAVEIEWKSSDESIISIDNDGIAVALTGGTAIISASVILDGGTVTAQETIIVPNVEPEIRIVNPIEEIKVGNTHAYQATYFNNNAMEEAIDIVWQSSDETVITMDENGLATALAAGTVSITALVALDDGTIQAENTVLVTQDFVDPEIRILNPIEELTISFSHSFEALYFNNLGVPEALPIIWESSDTDIVSIDTEGVATALTEGTAIISAAVDTGDGIINTETSLTTTPNFVDPIVNILNPLTEIEANDTHGYQAIFFNNLGEQENATINWQSSDTNVIIIDANGLATALSEGTATISASVQTTDGIVSDENIVTVTPDFVDPEVRILNPIAELEVDASHTYEAIFFNNLGEQENVAIQWESSNTGRISIDANGLAIARAEGTATISALVQYENAIVRADVGITITPKPEPIVKQGTILTTSQYILQGGFTMTENNNGGIFLDITEDYRADTDLPGLYLYLTNNPNSVNGALEVGAVEVFSGAHDYTIPNTGINDYRYLLYWCKPFVVKVGEGLIED